MAVPIYPLFIQYEWQPPDKLLPREAEGELLFSNPDFGEIVARIDNTGSLYTQTGFHCGMDDVNDACAAASAPPGSEACEQYFLDHPPSVAFKMIGSEGAVAYIDAGKVFPSDTDEGDPTLGLFGGNIRLKGRVFEEWTHWDYWD